MEAKSPHPGGALDWRRVHRALSLEGGGSFGGWCDRHDAGEGSSCVSCIVERSPLTRAVHLIGAVCIAPSPSRERGASGAGVTGTTRVRGVTN